MQGLSIAAVTDPVLADLLFPECGSGLRQFEQITVVPMPETSMHEDGDTVFGKDNVRLTRKVPDMQAKAEAARKKQLPQYNFRLCVLTPDRTHIPAAALRCMNVDHPVRLPTGGSCQIQPEPYPE